MAGCRVSLPKGKTTSLQCSMMLGLTLQQSIDII